MVRLKLQLFALNTKTSIVDYLKSQGKDSSMSARKEIAKELGIKNYSGTAEQNIQMLNTLKSQSSSASSNGTKTNTANANKANTNNANANKGTNASNGTNTTNVSAINGADQSLVDKVTSGFTQSDKVTNLQTEAEADRGAYKELANTSFKDTDGYKLYSEAWATTQQQLEKITSGRTSYTDQIKGMMDKIMNREKFQYDVSEDTMFQQMLASSMASGQSAMQDTIGQASALTGGYASTYATSAGNQAYNAYIQDAYNNLPEYYNMALEAYQMEGQEMYNQLAMLNEADATEYGRTYDAWQANFNTAQNIYNQEYGAYRDSVNDAYNVYQTSKDSADTAYAQELQKWQAETDNAMTYMGMQNSDYWNNKNFIEGQRQYDTTLAWNKESFAKEQAQKQAQFEASQKQNQSQFEASQKQNNDHFMLSNYDFNGDGKVDSKDTEYKAQMDAKEYAKTTNIDQKYFSGALEAYNKGGTAELNKYLNSLSYTYGDSELEAIASYAGEYGNAPLATRTLKVVRQSGTNWIGGSNGNLIVEDEYGNRFTEADIEKEDEALAKTLRGLKEGETYSPK